MLAPFKAADGSLMHFPERFYEIEWREVDEIRATLDLVSMGRGRSAAYFVWKDDDGATYPMFMTDMEHLLNSTTIALGRTLPSVWVVRKRGQNYGIRFVRETA